MTAMDARREDGISDARTAERRISNGVKTGHKPANSVSRGHKNGTQPRVPTMVCDIR